MGYFEKLVSDECEVKVEIHGPDYFKSEYRVIVQSGISLIEVKESDVSGTISALKLAKKRIKKDKKQEIKRRKYKNGTK